MKLLKEVNDFTYDYEQVKKSTEEGGPLIVKGILQRCDTINQNGRIYPREILEPQIEHYKSLVEERRAVGELDHADEPVVNLKNASHLITKIWIEPDGVVMGEVEVLKTPMGDILRSLIESNVKVGISSRALGSLTEGYDGNIVQDDLHLICWDMVSEPSTPNAFMSLKEGREYSRDEIKKILSRNDRVNMSMQEILNFHKNITQK